MPVEPTDLKQANERMILASIKMFYPLKADTKFEPLWWVLASHPSTPPFMIKHLQGVVSRVVKSMICECDSECEESCLVAQHCDRLSVLLTMLQDHEVF